jgi:hypothetical protein
LITEIKDTEPQVTREIKDLIILKLPQVSDAVCINVRSKLSAFSTVKPASAIGTSTTHNRRHSIELTIRDTAPKKKKLGAQNCNPERR